MNLIDIAAFDPDRLTLDNGLLNDCRLLDDWLLDNDRLLNNRRLLYNDSRAPVDNCACDRPTDHTTDEPRPEVPSARPPIPAVIVMVATVPSVMVISTVPAVRKRTGRGCYEDDCYYEFLHWMSPFLFR